LKHCLAVVLVGFCCVTLSGDLRAHDPFEVSTEARVHGDELVAQVTMARSTAARLAGGVIWGATLTAQEFASYRSKLEAVASSLYEVTMDDRVLPVLDRAVQLTDTGDVLFVLRYSLRQPGSHLRMRATHLKLLGDGYTSALRLTLPEVNRTRFDVLTSSRTAVDFDLHAGRAAPRAEDGTNARSFGRFLLLGTQHVLTGFDHLLFLIGVLLGCRVSRQVLLLITAFTLAHSLTLALAALGQINLSPGIVEPTIAASIVFMGLENLWPHTNFGRQLTLVFVFGLVHGLGFARALTELGVLGAPLAVTLLPFNLGVELGQLAFAVLTLPLLLTLRAGVKGKQRMRWASALVSAVGLMWLLQRLA
jgi:hydrogenase/urease accessory protein HupE